jgi:tRNA(Ile)-lysidine synthase
MGQADLASAADNLEQAARHARLAFFRQAMAAGAVDRVALGHTRSDQAETVLFRFLRGSGTAGLAGIRPVTSDGLIRPLLEIERADVEQFLRDRSIAWREDPSNAGARFARNRIRHDLLPLLARDWNPSIGETLANTADWALAEEAYWEAEIDRLAPGLMREAGGTVVLRVEALRCLPVAAARRLVRHAMTLVKGDLRGIDFGHIAAVMQMVAAAEGHGRLQAPASTFTGRSIGFVWRGPEPTPWPIGTTASPPPSPALSRSPARAAWCTSNSLKKWKLRERWIPYIIVVRVA